MRQQQRTLDDVTVLVSRLGPGPWPTQALLDAGWTHRRIRRATEAGRLVRLARGVLAAPVGAATLRARAAAALLRAPDGAVVSHVTAASLQGLWLPRGVRAEREPIHLTCPGVHDETRDDLHLHGSPLPGDQVGSADGMAATAVARSAVDLARGRRLGDALAALDSAARRLEARTTWVGEFRDLDRRALSGQRACAELARTLRSQDGWPGIAVARDALALVDLGSESPLESWSRAETHLAGLPSPQIGWAVQGASGTWYSVDFLWDEHGVIGEADGYGKYGTDPAEVADRLAAERRRERDLVAAGYTVVRWDWRQPPSDWTARVAQALGIAPAVPTGRPSLAVRRGSATR